MTPYIGQITVFGFNFNPRGWAKCQGQLLAISQYTALFSLIGTTYGGDGRTSFGLPDLRGRSFIGPGNAPGLSNINWGQKSGVENISLTTAHMPSHTHRYNQQLNVSNEAGDLGTPGGSFLAAHGGAYNEDPAGQRNFQTANAGNGQSFSVREPFLGLNVCIALEGIFPSRS